MSGRSKGGRMKTTVEVASAIRLEDAYFCLSCEAVTNCVDICPACGHRQLWPLQNWLGRVNNHETSRYRKSELAEVQPERTLVIDKTPIRKNYWQMVWNWNLKA